MRPVRIKRLELSNIGPFVGASIDFPPPTTDRGELILFEGSNGCGKTTILEAIACLLGYASPVNPASGLITRRFHDNSALLSVAITLEHSSEEIAFHVFEAHTVEVANHPGPPARLLRLYRGAGGVANNGPEVAWAAFMYRSHGSSNPRFDAQGVAPDLNLGEHPHKAALCQEHGYRGHDIAYLLLSLKNEQLRALGQAHTKPERSSYYEAVADSSARAIERLRVAMSRVLDRDVGIDFGDDDKSVAVLIDGKQIDPELLGEGMRSSLHWLADLLFRLQLTKWEDKTLSPWEQEFWLILDEVEASLHPSRQAQIIPAIRSLFPNAHIYAATHSPFVVASAGSGVVIPIRPDADRMVRGPIQPRALEQGQSLEWVVKNIFNINYRFMDPDTRRDLDEHEREVAAITKHDPEFVWSEFLTRRGRLMRTNAYVGTVVLMRELGVRDIIDAKMTESDEPV